MVPRKKVLWLTVLVMSGILWTGSLIWLVWLKDLTRFEPISEESSILSIFFLILGSFLLWVSYEVLFSGHEFLPLPKMVIANRIIALVIYIITVVAFGYLLAFMGWFLCQTEWNLVLFSTLLVLSIIVIVVMIHFISKIIDILSYFQIRSRK